ncbi:MAG: YqcI/YcgG family protein [Asticcacaulis sp.]|nr:YqcI/YcgG family protein [Asticcacaulis sp.]
MRATPMAAATAAQSSTDTIDICRVLAIERLTEDQFEAAMWRRIQALETLDAKAGHSYDPRVSPDVADKNFSLSFAGEAFFVVGLHPSASRPARQFDVPVMVFNAHDQFEALPFGAFVNKGLTLKSGQTHVHRYLPILLEKIEKGEIDPSFVITHRGSLDDAPDLYKTFRDKKDGCIKCVMTP